MEDNEKKVLLDGNQVTIEELQEKQQDKSKKIIEQGDGEYKTLQRLKG